MQSQDEGDSASVLLKEDGLLHTGQGGGLTYDSTMNKKYLVAATVDDPRIDYVSAHYRS